MIVRQAMGGVKIVRFNTHSNEVITPNSIEVIEGNTISNIPTKRRAISFKR